VLRVTLQRPEVRNAFDDRMVRELSAVLEQAAADETLRCLVLSGAGKVFCAGADLEWMRRAASYGQRENEEDARRMSLLFRLLYEMPMLTVARIQGAALGGGTGLAACCDVTIAEEGARFGFTEVRLGIVPAVISAFVLRKISRGEARRYFQTGELFDGRRAERMGLISEAVPAETLDARVEEVVAAVLRAGPAASRLAKRLVEDVMDAPFPDVLEETSGLIARLRATPEAREGMAAFLEKRRPKWSLEEEGS